MSCPKENIIHATCVIRWARRLVMKAYFYITDFYRVTEVACHALQKIVWRLKGYYMIYDYILYDDHISIQ